tara:strand:- start:366 stop:578 length:213 start_codon:yes stop_codon:yes gene_type:complete
MNEWLLFTIGFMIGGSGGVLAMALLGVRRYNNMEGEIQDLRTQRKLLKEELLKQESRKPKSRKPKPRKRR